MKHIFFPLSVLLAFTLVVSTSCKKTNSGNNGQGSLAGNWQQTNGPCNGLIESAAIKGTMIFAGDAQGGMYISPDLGKSWSQVTNGMSIYASVTAVLIHNDTIMAAGDGIYRSTNSGQTWTQLGNDLYFSDLRAMAWIGNRIMLCTDYWGNLYISDDNGYTWNQCPEHVPDYYVSGATILGKDIFVSSDVNGIYKSTDNGQTYTLSNNGLTSVHVYTLGTNGNNIYASTGDGLFVSADHGATWTIISNSLFNIQGINRLAFGGSTILAGGYSGLLFSMDDGVTWKQAVNGLSDPRIESLAVSGSTFLAGTPSGVYMSVNSGQTWSANGLPITFVSSLCSNGSDIFACASQMTGGIFTTSDFGQNWNFMLGGIPTYSVGSIAWNGTDMLAATDSGVYVSADRGLTWSKKSHGIPVDEYSTVTCVAGDGTNLYAGTYSYGLFVSHDGGDNWTHTTLPVEDNKYAMCLYVKGSIVYAGTFFGGVLFSSDNGQTWTSRSSGLPSLTGYTSIVQSGSRLFVSSLGGVYVSGDEGHTWVSAGSELTGKVIYSLATNGSILVAAAADNGVYISRDQGGSWFPANDGLPAKTRAMCVAVNGPWLFVGTDGQGAWRHPLGN